MGALGGESSPPHLLRDRYLTCMHSICPITALQGRQPCLHVTGGEPKAGAGRYMAPKAMQPVET